jgi:MoxR-like ATPase
MNDTAAVEEPASEHGGSPLPADPEELRALTERFKQRMDDVRGQVSRVIVGQDDAVEHLLVSMLVGGHCLITGLPGTAKTLMIRTLAQALGLTFRRIQFTPDLMPTDVTGTDVLDEDPSTGRRSWSFMPGPLFTHVLLADEINRTPPKTQSALLEAMQELSVTVRGRTYAIDPPFLVLATQNPIELEGTYPLPEAQLDRFLFNVQLDYLSAEQEEEVLHRTASETPMPSASACLDAADILLFQKLVRAVPISRDVTQLAVRIVRATRPGESDAPEIVRTNVSYGASVRATIFLALAGKARALLRGRYHVTEDDVRTLALPILRHRVLRSYQAEAQGIAVDDVLRAVVRDVKVG